jgi:ABC-type phosphate/phosphonate transport system substrate-binding protein
MYNAGPRAAAAWCALFEPVFAELALDIRIVEHRWPEPLAALWERSDLCCSFMCGWPFARSVRAMQAIAAPVPSPPSYAGLPRYRSEFLVREASGWSTLEESFGHRFGWMATDSQSGFNAPRAHLARLRGAGRGRLYGEVRGPLGTPAATLEALRSGAVDVVALDSYFLDLCRRHQPEAVAAMRTVARTPWAPIPLLVAAPGIDPRIVERLRARLLSLHGAPEYAPRLADVLLERFAVPEPDAYPALEAMAALAAEQGYETIR